MGSSSSLAEGLAFPVKFAVRLGCAAAALSASHLLLFPYATLIVPLPSFEMDMDWALKNPTLLVELDRGIATHWYQNTSLLPFLVLALPMLAGPRHRVLAYLGTLLGFIGGWLAAIAVFGDGAAFPYFAWGLRVGLIGAMAMGMLWVIHPLLNAFDRFVTSQRGYRLAGAVGAFGATVIGYSNVAEYIEGRLDMRQDRGQMQRLYRALVLYELDNNGVSASSLADVAPTYIEPAELASPADVDVAPRRGLYPANLYVREGPGADRQVPYPISYAYAGSFAWSFKETMPWEAYQASPTAGLLSNSHYRYRAGPAPMGLPEHVKDRYKDRGPYMRILNDGSLSIVSIPKSDSNSIHPTYQFLFLADVKGHVDMKQFRTR